MLELSLNKNSGLKKLRLKSDRGLNRQYKGEKFMKKIYFLLNLFFPFLVFGIVDTRSAGYSKTFVDFNEGLLKIERTYNSRSLYNGLFGFGWCSNLETQLTELPDNSIKVVECGGGREFLYHPKGKLPDVQLYVSQILQKIKERKIKMSPRSLKKLKKDLLQSPNLRSHFLEALDIKGQAKAGLKYYAQGRGTEYIFMTSKGFVRKLPNGLRDVFNKKGRLIESSNQEGKIEITWKANKIQVMDQRGRRLTFHLDKSGSKINKAFFGKKLVVSFTHKGENLTKIKNHQSGEVYRHEYDNLHNLTKNVYPNKTTEVLTYNEKKDWVIGFKDRKNCQETYSYAMNKENSNHYFSTVEKKCGRRIVHSSKYEFWHKNKPGGGKYLYRASSRVKGRLKTDVIYHPVFGTPVSFFKDGIRTKRDYYANGFLKEKDNKYQNVKYSKYNQKCRKPEMIRIGYRNPFAKSKRKFVRQEQVSFQFDKKCQLLQAKKSNDEWIRVRHDSKGRLVYMEDQSRKKVTLKWHKTLDKPEVITRAGVGSIRLVYNDQGAIQDIKGLQAGPSIITQVASVFNSFLKTLSPVSGEMVIL